MKTDKNISKEVTAETESISTTLSQIKKESIFAVPKGYFEEFPDKIKEKCDVNDLYKHGGILRFINIKSISVAASIILIAVSLLVYNIKDNSHSLLAINNFSSEEISAYFISENISDLSEGELIDELSNIEHFLVAQETDEIIDYLLEDDIDLTTIINEIN